MTQRVRFRRKADIAIPTQGHKRGDMGIAREWNLTWRLRLAVVCCALGYLLFARPWSEPNPSIAVDAYMCSAAILTMVANLNAMDGICAVDDGEEIGVKNTNAFNEQWNIYFSRGLVRRTYVTTCSPAAF